MTNQFYEMLTEFKGMPWVLCKARKPTTCHATGSVIRVGDYVYRPVTNGKDRMYRIKAGFRHMHKIKELVK